MEGVEDRTVALPVREPGSRPDERPCRQTSEATLLAEDGVVLTGIEGFAVLDDGRLLLGHIDNPGALLRYYFGRGGRQIILSLATESIEGCLDTSWAGNGRRWWLELREVAHPVVPQTVGEAGSDAAHGQPFSADHTPWLLDDFATSTAQRARPVSTVR